MVPEYLLFTPAQAAALKQSATQCNQTLDQFEESNTFYWLDAASLRNVSYTVTLSNGQTLSSPTIFNVVGPTAPNMAVSLGVVTAWPTPYNSLTFGCPQNPGTLTATCPPQVVSGIKLTASETDPPGFPGTISFVQILTTVTDYLISSSGGVRSQCALNFAAELDTVYPYLGVNQTTDNPSVNLLSTTSEEGEYFTAQMYAMWTPNLAAAIPVPLGSVTWNFASDAAYSSLFNLWALTPNSTNLNSAGVPNAGTYLPFSASISYPSWSIVNSQSLTNGASQCGPLQ